MNKPNISSNFTIDDIHKIRKYHHAEVMSLSEADKRDYYKNRAFEFLKKAGIQPKEIIQL